MRDVIHSHIEYHCFFQLDFINQCFTESSVVTWRQTQMEKGERNRGMHYYAEWRRFRVGILYPFFAHFPPKLELIFGGNFENKPSLWVRNICRMTNSTKNIQMSSCYFFTFVHGVPHCASALTITFQSTLSKLGSIHWSRTEHALAAGRA